MNRKPIMSSLSPNEIKMFRDLGKENLLNVLDANDIVWLYRFAMEKAFVGECYDVDAVAALQRAILHFRAGKFRGNDEFEQLIKY